MEETDCHRSVRGMFRYNNVCNNSEDENKIKQGFKLQRGNIDPVK